MKLVQSLIIFALVSSQAQAAGILASFDFQAGFAPRPIDYSVRILDDGNVVVLEEALNAKHRTIQLGTIALERVERLQNLIDSVQEEALTDLQEGLPPCMDAPSSVYSIRQGSTRMNIARRSGCHNYELSGQKFIVRPIIEILKGFQNLYWLD